jgi:hypothetical protein
MRLFSRGDTMANRSLSRRALRVADCGSNASWLRGVSCSSPSSFFRSAKTSASRGALAGNQGPKKLGLVRQAAALTVQVEALQARIVAGEDVDLEQWTRLSNVLGRTLQRLGLKKPRGKPTVALTSIDEGLALAEEIGEHVSDSFLYPAAWRTPAEARLG